MSRFPLRVHSLLLAATCLWGLSANCGAQQENEARQRRETGVERRESNGHREVSEQGLRQRPREAEARRQRGASLWSQLKPEIAELLQAGDADKAQRQLREFRERIGQLARELLDDDDVKKVEDKAEDEEVEGDDEEVEDADADEDEDEEADEDEDEDEDEDARREDGERRQLRFEFGIDADSGWAEQVEEVVRDLTAMLRREFRNEPPRPRSEQRPRQTERGRELERRPPRRDLIAGAPGRPGDPRQARRRHLQSAIQHLQAAGLVDLAGELLRQQEELLARPPQGAGERERGPDQESPDVHRRELEEIRAQVENRLHDMERALDDVNRATERRIEELERTVQRSVEDSQREAAGQLEELRRQLREQPRRD